MTELNASRAPLLLCVRALAHVPVVSVLSLVMLGIAMWLCIDSRRQSRVLGFITPAGNLQALGSDRVGIVLFFSDIPCGREMALMADVWRIPANETKILDDAIFEKANQKLRVAGFHFSRRTWRLSGIQSCRSEALLVPYWFIAPLLAILPVGVVRRITIRTLRKRRGECVECGYNLRYSTGRCPECGASMTDGSARRQNHSFFPLLSILLLLATLITGLSFVIRRSRQLPRDDFEPMERRAGLDCHIPFIHFSSVPIVQAIDELANLSGTHITLSPKLAAQKVYTPSQNLWVAWGERLARRWDFEDVKLSSMLDLIVAPEASGYPDAEYAAGDDGTIVIDHHYSLPHVLRTYDVRDVLTKLRPPESHRGGAFAGGSISIPGGSVVRPYDAPERQLVAMVTSPHVNFATPFPQIAWCGGGCLAVLETRRGHARVRKLLDRLREMPSVWQNR